MRWVWRWIAGLLAVAIVFAAVSTTVRHRALLGAGVDSTWLAAARPSILSNGTTAVMFVVALLLVWRLPLSPARWPRSVAIHLLVAAALLLLHTLLYHHAGASFGWVPEMRFRDRVQTAPIHLVLYASIVGFGYALVYVHGAREQELRARTLAASLARTELEVLRFQLHPRFLFQALRGISTLMRHDVRAADRMIARLGDLLRLLLERMDAERVTLRDELELLGAYVEVERARHGDRLRLDTHGAPGAMEAMVPHLILQPLVEAAVAQDGAGAVVIRAEIAGDALRLEVRCDETGGTMDPAIEALRARLAQLYGDRPAASLHGRDAGRTVVMELPLRDAAGAAVPR